VRSLLRRLDALDLELEPVAFLEVMDAAIEREQELEPMSVSAYVHIIS
jgi:hypothetical protein